MITEENALRVYSEITQRPSGFVLGNLEDLGSFDFFSREYSLGIEELGQAIRRLSICMGPEKAAFFTPLVSSICDQVCRIDSCTTQELRSSSPDLVARSKLTGADSDGLLIGQDVVLMCGDDPLHKTLHEDKTEIKQELSSLLVVDQPINFEVRDGLAVGENSQRGVSYLSKMRFEVSPLSFEEVETYVSSLTIDDLSATSGCLRWPHPILINHIQVVDGIVRGQEDYYEKLTELIMRLLGPNPSYIQRIYCAIGVLEEIIKALENEWMRLVILKNSSEAELVDLNKREFDDGIYQDISNLVCRNFREHPHYQGLTQDARERYAQANSPEGTRQACLCERNIAVLVLKQKGSVIGYLVLRKEEEDTVEIRRLHTLISHGNLGVATYLLTEAERIALDGGFRTIAVPASGESDEAFFLKNGYNGSGRALNSKLLREGISAPVHYLMKNL